MVNQYSDFTNEVLDFATYDKFLTSTKVGHVADYNMDLESVIAQLTRVKGHIVHMPLRYMESVSLDHPSFEINEMTSDVPLF